VLPYLQANPDEKDVGMIAYISPEQLGFTGVLKQRYSDFIVHEIDMAGDLCILKDAPGFVDLPVVPAEAPQHAQSSSPESADTVIAVTTTISKIETQSPDDSNAKEIESAPIGAPVLTELEVECAAIVKGITAMRELLGNEIADDLQQFLLAVVTEEHSIADDKRHTATMKAQQQQQQHQVSVDASTNTESNNDVSTSTSNDSMKRKADVLLNNTETAADASTASTAATAQEVMPVIKKPKLDCDDDTTIAAVAKHRLTPSLPLKNAAGRYVHELPLEVAANKQDRGKVSVCQLLYVAALATSISLAYAL
jgi:hypothetical protein